MRWWVRSQHPIWVIGAALAGTLVVAFSPNSIALPVPSLSGTTAFAAIRPHALISVLITVSVWASASAGHKSAILSAVRGMKLYVLASLCAALGTCVLVAGLWAVLVGQLGSPLQLLVRDLLGLLGLGLILLPLTGYRFAGVVTTVYVFVSAIFGRTSGGGTHDSALWAWPASESTAFDYWIPAILLFVAGGLVWILRSRVLYSRVMIAQAMDARRE
jgi:hypothetical protein